jgi:glycosyltransferase involved in cell wall biosynthesis
MTSRLPAFPTEPHIDARSAPGGDDSGSDSTTVVFAYFFYPSPEVGAKRMSALAEYLRESDRHVSVLSAFTGLDAFAQDDVRWSKLRGYKLVRVPDAPSRTVAFLVRLKRHLRQLLMSRSSTVASGAASRRAPSEGVAERGWSALRRYLFLFLHVIDDHKGWAVRAARRAINVAGRTHSPVIVVSGPPASVVLAATWAARNSGVPVIVDLRDPICMETVSGEPAAGIPNQWGRRWLERYVVRRADGIVTTSPSLRRQLQQRYPQHAERITCILNGFDENPRPSRVHTEHRLVIVYAGTLYLNRNPFPFLEAVEWLLSHADVDASRVEIVFAGDCHEYRGTPLRTWLDQRRCGSRVTILPQLDPQPLRMLYERATLLLNFAEGQRMQIPAKTFELLALGREILVLCEPDSDTGRLVAGLSGVSCAASSDAPRLQELLWDAYQRHAIAGTLRAPPPGEIAQFSRASQNERFVSLIENARRAGAGTR